MWCMVHVHASVIALPELVSKLIFLILYFLNKNKNWGSGHVLHNISTVWGTPCSRTHPITPGGSLREEGRSLVLDGGEGGGVGML